MPEDLALASTWNPRGESGRLAKMWPLVREFYCSVSIVVPPEASRPELERQTRVPGHTFCAAADWKLGRHEALQRAVDSRVPAIQYVDMDHLLRWIETCRDEWRDIARRATRSKFLVVGRSPQAYSTHPSAIRETERPINNLFSRVFGRPMDVCVGARGMTRDVARLVLRQGTSTEAFCVDTEWPSIAYTHGIAIDYVEAEGLDWESADRHRNSAAGADRQSRLAALYDQDPDNWAYRRRSAKAMIRSGVAALRRGRDSHHRDMTPAEDDLSTTARAAVLLALSDNDGELPASVLYDSAEGLTHACRRSVVNARYRLEQEGLLRKIETRRSYRLTRAGRTEVNRMKRDPGHLQNSTTLWTARPHPA